MNDYRDMLKRLLDEKKARNARFSLRAFAQKIGLSHSTLSQVFKGERNLSLQTAHRIANTLKMKGEERELFLLRVELAGLESEDRAPVEAKILALERFRSSPVLDAGTTELLGDWLRFAIYSVAQMNWDNFSAQFLADSLKVPLKDVEAELANLEKKGLLLKDKKPKLSDRKWFNPQNVDDILRLHQELLRRHREAIVSDDVNRLISWSESLAITIDQIPEAEEITRDFIQRMSALSDKARAKTESERELYVLTVVFTNMLNSRWKK
jgi:uncharacterized protein (TIGR02147 family)